jgi:hypothetical protein
VVGRKSSVKSTSKSGGKTIQTESGKMIKPSKVIMNKISKYSAPAYPEANLQFSTQVPVVDVQIEGIIGLGLERGAILPTKKEGKLVLLTRKGIEEFDISTVDTIEKVDILPAGKSIEDLSYIPIGKYKIFDYTRMEDPQGKIIMADREDITSLIHKGWKIAEKTYLSEDEIWSKWDYVWRVFPDVHREVRRIGSGSEYNIFILELIYGTERGGHINVWREPTNDDKEEIQSGSKYIKLSNDGKLVLFDTLNFMDWSNAKEMFTGITDYWERKKSTEELWYWLKQNM